MSPTQLVVVDAKDGDGDVIRTLQRALDRPIRAALEMSRGSPLFIAGVAAIGAFLIATTSAASALLGGDLPLEGARAAFEAMAVVIPSSIVFSTYSRVRPTPGALFAAASLGMLLAGLVALSVLPLLAFIASATQSSRAVDVVFQLFIPTLAVAVIGRQWQAFLAKTDERPRAQLIAFVTFSLLAVIYAIRVEPVLAHLGLWRTFR